MAAENWNAEGGWVSRLDVTACQRFFSKHPCITPMIFKNNQINSNWAICRWVHILPSCRHSLISGLAGDLVSGQLFSPSFLLNSLERFMEQIIRYWILPDPRRRLVILSPCTWRVLSCVTFTVCPLSVYVLSHRAIAHGTCFWAQPVLYSLLELYPRWRF